jgi:hypothetical protein
MEIKISTITNSPISGSQSSYIMHFFLWSCNNIPVAHCIHNETRHKYFKARSYNTYMLQSVQLMFLKYAEELYENIFRASYINTMKFLCNTPLKNLKNTISELVQKIKKCVRWMKVINQDNQSTVFWNVTSHSLQAYRKHSLGT